MQFYVVSGGLQAVVREVFRVVEEQKGIKGDIVYCMTPEVYEDEKLIDFGKPIITSHNKHNYVNHEIHKDVKEGTNAILLGDLVEDHLIVKNLKMKNVIGIGFLNVIGEYSKEMLEKYAEVFDIIIIQDGNLTHAVELIKSIIGVPLDADYPKKGSGAVRLAEVFK